LAGFGNDSENQGPMLLAQLCLRTGYEASSLLGIDLAMESPPILGCPK
jgi:hypothetical protein